MIIIYLLCKILFDSSYGAVNNANIFRGYDNNLHDTEAVMLDMMHPLRKRENKVDINLFLNILQIIFLWKNLVNQVKTPYSDNIALLWHCEVSFKFGKCYCYQGAKGKHLLYGFCNNLINYKYGSYVMSPQALRPGAIDSPWTNI